MPKKVRNRAGFTHFISIPLKDEFLKKQIKNFQEEIRKVSVDQDLKAHSSYIAPSRMHLTLGMLTLSNLAEIEKATALLQSLEAEIKSMLNNKPIEIAYVGTSFFTNHLKRASVLYINAFDHDFYNSWKSGAARHSIYSDRGDSTLLKACNLIRASFYKSGILKENRHLVLHNTIINTKSFNKNKVKTQTANCSLEASDPRQDSSEFIKELCRQNKYKEFGIFTVQEVCIAKRFSFNPDNSYFSEGGMFL